MERPDASGRGRGRALAAGGGRSVWAALPILALPFAAVAAPSGAGSPGAFTGRQVVAVELHVDGRPVADAEALDVIETPVGTPLAMREVRESLAHLMSLGRYGHVSVDGVPRAGGVALVYRAREVEVIDRLRLSGTRVLSDDDLRRVVTRRHGDRYPVGEAAAVAETVRRFYRERGFLAATVEPRLRGTSTRRELELAVTAGRRARVRRWFITGVASASRNAAIRSRLGLVNGAAYDGAALDQRLDEYVAELRAQRYYGARLSHSVEPRGQDEVDVRLHFERGPRITIGLTGDSVPNADLDVLVPVAREASVDEDLLEDADRRITAHLRAHGYRDAEVGHTRTLTGDELAIVFSVRRGPRYEIAAVRVDGHEHVSGERLIALAGLAPGDPFAPVAVDDGLTAIEEEYRQQGFAAARATATAPATATTPGAPAGVRRPAVDIDISEGPRMTIRAVQFIGAAAWPAEHLHEWIETRVGDPFYGPQVSRDRDALLARYLNEGYERAVVRVQSQFAEDLRSAAVTFQIVEGHQVLVEHVLVAGNRHVDTETIRRELTVAAGQPLGLDELAETRRRLNALGLFRRIEIREFSHGPADRRDLVIVVEEAPATTLAYGGGLEVSQRLRRGVGSGEGAVEQIELAPRGSFEIGRRNLWGRNRTVNLFTRASVRRQNEPTEPGLIEGPRTLGFNEYRILGTYRESRTLQRNWDVLVSGFVEQAIRPGFDLLSRGVSAQVITQSTGTMSTTFGYRLGKNDTANRELDLEDSNIVDRLFPEVRLSSFRLGRVRDTRDDPFEPSRGTVLTAETELAARAVGSAVGFTKTFLSGSVYRALNRSARLVFAAGARVGMAWGFSQTFVVDGLEVRRTLDLPISERFFAGGDATVRGFALDRLGGPRDTTGGTIDSNGFPQGGNAMLIMNSELRFGLTRAIGLVTFLDAGNIYDQVQHMSLRRVRGGAGFGVRYNSPVGPFRIDLGFKLGERHSFGRGATQIQEPLTALHISIGQAF